MNNCLIILTNSFPFGSGESYIESEIKHHKDNFSEVIILAQEAAPGAKCVYNVPDGIKYINISEKSKFIGRCGDLKQAFYHLPKKTEVFRHDRNEVSASLTKRMFLEYFEARSRRQLSESLSRLRDFDFSVFDGVVIYSYWFFVTARVAMLLKQSINNNNVSLVSRSHGYDTYMYANSLNYLPLRKMLLSEFDMLYVCSKDGSDYLKKNYPDYSDKIKTQYLGTTDYGIKPRPSRQPFKIVSCSRAVSLKRIDRIISALSLFKDSGIKIEWTHIGSGPESEKIKKLAERSLGFMKYTLIGNLSNDDVLKLYSKQNFNLFVNVSEREGLPVSIMEAMSFGIPVIATDVGGTSEAVVDSENGRLMPKDFSDRHLVDLISEFINMDDAKYICYSENARRCWSDNFSAENNHSAFSKEICSLVNR